MEKGEEDVPCITRKSGRDVVCTWKKQRLCKKEEHTKSNHAISTTDLVKVNNSIHS